MLTCISRVGCRMAAYSSEVMGVRCKKEYALARSSQGRVESGDHGGRVGVGRRGENHTYVEEAVHGFHDAGAAPRWVVHGPICDKLDGGEADREKCAERGSLRLASLRRSPGVASEISTVALIVTMRVRTFPSMNFDISIQECSYSSRSCGKHQN